MSKFKVGDKVSVFSKMNFQLPIFKKCTVTAINDDFIEIKASNGFVREVKEAQCEPYVEPEVKDEGLN